MRTSLEHLPEQKQQEIAAIAETLVQLVEPEMIILFGSHARGNWVADKYETADITYEYTSDYDILVVVEDEKRADTKAKRIRDQLKKYLHHELPLQIIVHGIDHFNAELEDGQYFFGDIVKEGVLIYDSGKFKIKKAKVKTAAERATTSQMYFDQWFPAANRFFDQALTAISKSYLDTAAFELHQAAERYFSTIELVFTHYKTKTHDLRQLNKWACIHDDRFKKAFPLQTAEEKRLFDLIVRAYIDSRYKMNYTIEVAELQYLSGCVERLQKLTGEICKEKIGEMGKND
jgi:predicted nucleotidyltransferase/HEPN domain-containing protein